MNTTNDKLNYLANTKVAIKDAIVAKGVAVSEADTFRSYAGKIGEIQSGGNEFSEIGYESTPQYILDGIEYAKKIQAEWDNPTNCASKFYKDAKLVFFPNVQTSQITKASGMFQESSLQYIDNLDLSNVEGGLSNTFRDTNLIGIKNLIISEKATGMYWAFFGSRTLVSLNSINSVNVTDFTQTFQDCRAMRAIYGLDYTSAKGVNGAYNNCHLLSHLKITNLGKSICTAYDFSGARKWGDDTNTWADGTPVVGSSQSLIDSLITYSYDRASAGMPTATITLHADVKARLTEEEIAIINSKGFTLA